MLLKMREKREVREGDLDVVEGDGREALLSGAKQRSAVVLERRRVVAYG